MKTVTHVSGTLIIEPAFKQHQVLQACDDADCTDRLQSWEMEADVPELLHQLIPSGSYRVMLMVD